MRSNHFFAERFQSPPRRDNLHQNVRTVLVRVHHFFDAFDLAFDPMQTDSQSSLRGKMTGSFRPHEIFGHCQQPNWFDLFAKTKLNQHGENKQRGNLKNS